MTKIDRLNQLIKNYEYLVDNDFIVPRGIGLRPDDERLSRSEGEISTGIFAEKIPTMSGIERFTIIEGEYIPTGEQMHAYEEAIKLFDEIKALRKELEIEDTPLKGEEEILLARKKTKEVSRPVTLDKIKALVERETETSKNDAMNAVTNPENEKNQEGQTHDDE